MTTSDRPLPNKTRPSASSWVYVLPRQIPAAIWHRLARALVSHESWFGLVWRDGIDWSDRARGVRQFLGPMSLDRQRASHWPGTQAIGHEATVIRYHTSPAVLPLLLATDHPFAWLSPALPEDLFFGSADQLAFASVTHERDAWLLKRRYARLIGQDLTLTRERLTTRDFRLVQGLGIQPENRGRQ